MGDDFSISVRSGVTHFKEGKNLEDMTNEMAFQLGIDAEYNYQILEHYLVSAYGYFSAANNNAKSNTN